MRDPLLIKAIFAIVIGVWLIASVSMLRAKWLLKQATRHLNASERLNYTTQLQLTPNAPHVRQLLRGEGEAFHDAALAHLKRARRFGTVLFAFAAAFLIALFALPSK